MSAPGKIGENMVYGNAKVVEDISLILHILRRPVVPIECRDYDAITIFVEDLQGFMAAHIVRRHNLD